MDSGGIIFIDSPITSVGLWDFATAELNLQHVAEIYATYNNSEGSENTDEGREYDILGVDCKQTNPI